MGKKSKRNKTKQTEEEKAEIRRKNSEKCRVYAHAEQGGWRTLEPERKVVDNGSPSPPELMVGPPSCPPTPGS